MKKIILFSSLLIASMQAFSQGWPGCASINAGFDACASPCTTLNAAFKGLAAPTSYTVDIIPCSFQSFDGTPINVNTDDIWSPVINLGFSFCYFGNTFTQACISANGQLTFDLTRANQPSGYVIDDEGIPGHGGKGAYIPNNTICAAYRDIDPSVTGSATYIKTVGTAPCRMTVISWVNTPLFNQGTCGTPLPPKQTFQLVLYENSNFIDVCIQNSTSLSCTGGFNNGYGIIGIQNGNATVGVSPPNRNHPIKWTAVNEAWRFTPTGTAPSAAITWTGPSGTVGTGASVNVCPTVATTYTATATYTNCTGTNITVSDQVTVFTGPPVPTFTVAPRFCGTAPIVVNPAGSTNMGEYLWSIEEVDEYDNPFPNGYYWNNFATPAGPGTYTFPVSPPCNRRYLIKLWSNNACATYGGTTRITYLACSCSTDDGSTKTKAIDLGNTCFASITNNTLDPNLSNTYASTINATTMPNGQASNDMWFKFTVSPSATTATVDYKIHTCESALDTYIHLLDANSARIQENDDHDPTTDATRGALTPFYISDCEATPPLPIDNTLTSLVTSASNTQGVFDIKTTQHGHAARLQRGVTYYIVVEGYGPHRGPFSLVNYEACYLSPEKENKKIAAVASDIDMKVYPNPFTHTTTLKIDSNGGNSKIEITDVSGKTVYKNESYQTGEEITLGDSFMPGVYFVNVRNNETFITLKLIKIQ